MNHPYRLAALSLLAVLLATPAAPGQEVVDPRSGRLYLMVTDVAIPVGPITVEMSRTLDAERSERGLLGLRWRSNWESRLVRGPSQVVVDEASGPVAFAPASAGPGFVSPTGERVLFSADGRAVRTMADGGQERFDGQGRLIERDLRNGNTVALRYAPDGRLARIEGPRGSFLRFDTDGQGRLTRVDSSTGATVRYGYVRDDLTQVQVNGGPVIRYAHDASGLLVRMTDPLSGTVELAYDARRRVLSRRWADGSQERWEYDDAADRQRHIDPTGAITTTQWTQDRRRATVTGPLGHTTTMEYDGAGRLLSVTGPTGATARITYDGQGRTRSVQDPQGQVTRFEYVGESARIMAVNRPDGTRENFEYDSRGNLTARKLGSETLAAYTYHPDGSVATARGPGVPEERSTYDQAGRLIAIAGPLGGTTRFERDARGNVIRETNALGGQTLRSYDAQGRLLRVTDPAGRTTRYEYGAQGRLERTIDPAGSVTRYEYDARGRRVAAIDAEGRASRREYDAAGRVVKSTWPDGLTESFRYDAGGNLTEWTDRLGRITRFEYDPLGRAIGSRWATGLEGRRRHDVLGNLVGIEDTAGVKSEFEYDAAGRLTAITDAFKAITRYAYDPLGRLIGQTDQRGQRRTFTYGADGLLAGVREPSGDEGRYTYDAAGRLVAIRRPSGGVNRLGHDAAGNVTTEIDPLGSQWRYGYDAAGRVVESTDADGRVTRYAYDPAGRLAERLRADGTRVTYRYDKVGNLVAADDAAFPVRVSFDRAGRPTRVEYPAIKKAVSYEYDTAGLRTKLTDASGRVIRYEYGPEQRLAAIVLPGGPRVEVTFDDKERLRSIRYPNGLTGRREYEADDRISKITYVDRNGAVVREWTYRYDPAGNLTEDQDQQGGVRRFAYDAVGQLTEAAGAAGTVRYRYQAGGNRAAVEDGSGVTAYRHDAADRLVQAGPEQLSYDASGNLVGRTTPEGATTYAYDTDGRLANVTRGGESTTFGYAPTGQRVWRRDPAGLRYFIYDAWDLIEELSETGASAVAYVHGPGRDQPLATIRDGRTYYYHADRLGNIRFLTDDQGQVVASYEYDAFGKITASQASVANPFGFTGREWDAGTGLYYHRARYYDPGLGRFLSPDPVRPRLDDPRNLNRYLYAWNNPLRFVDAMGLAPSLIGETALSGMSPEQALAYVRGELAHWRGIYQQIQAAALENPGGQSFRPPGAWQQLREGIAQLQALENKLASAPQTPPPPPPPGGGTAPPRPLPPHGSGTRPVRALPPEAVPPSSIAPPVEPVPPPSTPGTGTLTDVPVRPGGTGTLTDVPPAGSRPPGPPPAGYRWVWRAGGWVLIAWTLVSVATADDPDAAAIDAGVQLAGGSVPAAVGCTGIPGFIAGAGVAWCAKEAKDALVNTAKIATRAREIFPTHPENLPPPGFQSPPPLSPPIGSITGGLPGATPSAPPEEEFDPSKVAGKKPTDVAAAGGAAKGVEMVPGAKSPTESRSRPGAPVPKGYSEPAGTGADCGTPTTPPCPPGGPPAQQPCGLPGLPPCPPGRDTLADPDRMCLNPRTQRMERCSEVAATEPGSQAGTGSGTSAGSGTGKPPATSAAAPKTSPPAGGTQEVDLSGTWRATYRLAGQDFAFTMTLSRVAAGTWQGPLDYVFVGRPDLSFRAQATLKATAPGKVHLTYTDPRSGAKAADGTYSSTQITFGTPPQHVTYTKK